MTSHTQRPLSTLDSFLCGGLAASIAVTITNPAEVAKTRMQLQGIYSAGMSDELSQY